MPPRTALLFCSMGASWDLESPLLLQDGFISHWQLFQPARNFLSNDNAHAVRIIRTPARRDTLPSSGGRILCRQSHIGIVSQHEANTGGGRCEYFIQATPLRSTFAETCLDVAVHLQAATSSGHPQAVKINSECLQNVRERSRPIDFLSWKAAIVFPQAAVATFPAPRDAGRAGGRRSNRRRCMRDRA